MLCLMQTAIQAAPVSLQDLACCHDATQASMAVCAESALLTASSLTGTVKTAEVHVAVTERACQVWLR
jgi:hypothetical protein